MIKPSELRIGNIVNHIYNTIRIESICGDSVNVSAADMGGGPYIEGIECKDIEPIRLTAEWLTKFELSSLIHIQKRLGTLEKMDLPSLRITVPN